ncbi:hypothetical protein L3X38_025024 [Prunus dulcis]|uniref:Uncharacterized protein n=1 Tax=Prunus dulcis TaxID=3755 RepID=A0AAD4W3D6_PRUDU|nr:hypothetical protein L3X38_025024 [Prunus dulcis]
MLGFFTFEIQSSSYSSIAEVQLESFSVGADFFYKLIDETEWISSRLLDMVTFLIRKRQLSHPLVFGTDWTTADYCLQQFLESFKATAKKRGSKKAATSNTIDLPPSKLNSVHHYVPGTWQHGHTATLYDSYVGFAKTSKLVTLLHPISDTLRRVLYNMHFYEDSEVEEVKKNGLKMSSLEAVANCLTWHTHCFDFEGIFHFLHWESVSGLTEAYSFLNISQFSFDLVSVAILLFCLALCCYWNLEPHTVFADLSWSRYTSTIQLKNGKLSDLIGELQVRRLAAKVQQLGSSRQITVLKGNDSQIGFTSLIMPAATLGALGYG